MAATMDINQLPNLPGYAPRGHKQRNGRTQHWGYVNGQPMELREGISHDRPKFVRAVKPAEGWRSGNTIPDSTTREVYKASAQKDFDELPAWDALDRHVLRFYGCWKEAVVETNLENHRVRRCVLYYYLEDDTCHIAEPRQDNSGIPQGTFIRRHRFPAPNSGYLRPEDLRVGADLTVYGKTIRLTDCDAFTREYYESIGLEQGPPEEVPTDPFTETRTSMKVNKAMQERTYEKLYRESQLGGGHINEEMQQFMENDRRVCRFFAVLDDLTTPQYERRPFTILFFLADDTLEVRELYPLNCGRDNFPIFFRRARMPKVGGQLRGPFDQPLRKDDYVGVTDFAVGIQVNFGGQKYFIYDADSFTRDHFRNTLGTELAPKRDVRIPERGVARAPTPDYTGYGSWDDSMGSVMHLVPKVPRKDFKKLYNNDGKILRFTAKFKQAKPEDAQRRFVVSFHLFDDCVSIHEPPQRNLGIVTGKFLEKGVHLNQVTGRLFEPADLVPGQTIQVYNHEFEMLDMDEYTRKFAMEEGGDDRFDLSAVLQKLREGLRQQFPLVRDIFRRFDTDHNSAIGINEFKQALQKFGFMLSEREALVLMKYFDSRQDGQISYNEFCDALLDEDFTTEMLHTKPALDARPDSEYAGRAKDKADERAETEKVRRAVREIGDVLYKRAGAISKLYKEFEHMTHKGHVTVEQVHAAFMRIGQTFDFEDVQRCVLFVLPDVDMSQIDFVLLVKSIVSCYHDLPATR